MMMASDKQTYAPRIYTEDALIVQMNSVMFYTHITGQLLIVRHHLLILLVDSQHFADTVRSCLSLSGNTVMRPLHSDKDKSTHCQKPGEAVLLYVWKQDAAHQVDNARENYSIRTSSWPLTVQICDNTLHTQAVNKNTF